MGNNILVVDDDVDILDAIHYTLDNAGYTVTVTEKAAYVENLYKAHEPLPALIILDVLLSGKDGRDICKQLKSRNETKHIPILMISARPNTASTIKKYGADDFLEKPFEIVDLVKKIEKLIKKKK